MYKLIGQNSVKRVADGACIPFADGNRDYEEYKQWLVEGNTPEPEDAPTAEQIKAEIEQAIQGMLDAKAKELRYDNMMSARSYAGFDNPFQTEAQALAVWCANCWLVAGELESSGEAYTVEEVLAQMPEFAQ